VPFRERTTLEEVLADIEKYSRDETLPNRDILLCRTAGQVFRFTEDLMNEPTAMQSLLATIRVLRPNAKPEV
jgi:hypothetical protein